MAAKGFQQGAVPPKVGVKPASTLVSYHYAEPAVRSFATDPRLPAGAAVLGGDKVELSASALSGRAEDFWQVLGGDKVELSASAPGGAPASPGLTVAAAPLFHQVFNAQLLAALESPEIVEALARKLHADRKHGASQPCIELRELEADRSVVTEAAEEAQETLGTGMAELLDMMKDAPEAALALVERGAIVDLGKWLKALREERGMTQAQLAEAAGTTAAQISVIEAGTGQRGVSIGLLARLAYGLGWKLAFAPA